MDIAVLQKFNALGRRIAAMEEALRDKGILERPPQAPKPAEIPFVTNVLVTQRFRASVQHPFTVLANFTCPACGLNHEQVEFRIGDNGGTTTTACSCGSNLRVKLSWDVNLK